MGKSGPLRSERIAHLVHSVRGERVLFDADLAMLYGVPTKVLNQAVKRNHERFPSDFMFRPTEDEWIAMRSQIVTTSRRRLSTVPYAFTEQGVAMLSSVLRSPRAVAVNVAIMRLSSSSGQFAVVFDAIKRLIAEDEVRKASPRRRIGFIS